MKLSHSVCSLFLGLLCSLGCDGFTQISGHVIDVDGEPIQGAQVDLVDSTGGLSVDVTGSDGAFAVDMSHAPGDHPTLIVSRPEYETHKETIEAAADDYKFEREIVLKRKKD